MKVVDSPAALATALGSSAPTPAVGLVPTMGSLHEGHLSLIRMADAECATVVVSVFVNPTQFGDAGDLESYPRELEHDAQLAADAGADLIFAPAAETMYPEGFETWIELTETTRSLEGESRPGHFRGVATVCLKLFNIVAPDLVYFGWKDAQQSAVIGCMIRDLNVPTIMRLGATVREPDGLAMSSRNARLSPEERELASALPRALAAGDAAHAAHEDPARATRTLLEAEPAIEIDYVEEMFAHGHRLLCAAVCIGTTRLIDNVILEAPA